MGRPFCRLGARRPQYPLSDRHDQAGFFRKRDEFGGHDQAPLGMMPAQQRLKAADLAALEIDDRLVVEFELAIGKRAAHIPFEIAAGMHEFVQFGLEETERTAPAILGGVQREVRFLQDLIGIGSVARCDGNADAGSDGDPVIAEIERLAKRGLDPFGERHGFHRRGFSTHSMTANSSPPSRATIAVSLTHAQSRAATACNSASPVGCPSVSLTSLKRSRSSMSTARSAPPRRVMERASSNRFPKQDAIWQVGQRVMLGHMRDLGLGPALLGDVLVRRHPAAAGHWLPGNADQSTVGELVDPA